MWVNQGRTDAWIAHKLDVSIDDLTRFKREHELEGEEGTARLRPADPLSVPPPEPAAEQDEDEDEDEEPDEEPEEEVKPARAARGQRSGRAATSSSRRPRRDSGGGGAPRGRRPRRDEQDEDKSDDGRPRGQDADSEGDGEPRRRRRGRRGGRRHRARRNAFEATFDHGEEGYGLWLDPAVVDSPVYSEHWAGHRAVTVIVEADSITIRRANAATAPGNDDAPEPEVDEQD
jgi:hypothetical protein